VGTVPALVLLLAAAAAQADPALVICASRAFDGMHWSAGPRVVSCSAAGRIVDAPEADATWLTAPGLVVMPGLVDLRSSAGISTWPNEESAEVTPLHDMAHALDPSDASFEAALRSGITTVVANPGSRGVVAGQAAALPTDVEARGLRPRAIMQPLLITLGVEPWVGNRTPRDQVPWGLHFRRPGDRMGVVAELRRAVAMAREQPERADLEPLREALAGRRPAWWLARREADIRAAFALAKELGFPPPVLVDPIEAHRILDAVAAGASAAVVGPAYELPRGFPETFEGQDFRHALPGLLWQAGVKVALCSGPWDAPDALRDRAIMAARFGMPGEAALASMTSVPASLLGLGGEIGTLAPGASADLVVLDGDPLAPSTRVLAVIVEGQLRYRAASLPPPAPGTCSLEGPR
jgi:imidazolonepropionase-like amidohydrolase